jgi:uncharacterized protein YutE (UPF0331/DUF86 family)
VLSAYEHSFGRVGLIDRTAALVRAYDAIPGPAHRAFASIGFTDVITTNFDFLLERGYESIGKAAMPVVEEAQLASPNRRSGPRLIKLHGDIDHPDRMVLTEEDYDHFLQRYPLLATFVTAMLVNRTAMLIGYSLDDPDTRQLLVLIKRRLGRLSRFMWTIQIDAPAHVISRYERRGVRVVNLPKLEGTSISEQFRILFEELAAYWQKRMSQSTIGSDDRVTADIRVPSEPSRICYFAVPAKALGWYRDVVFPEVESRGFLPVTAGDMITQPGTVTTMIDVLIRRAQIVIVDLSNPWAEYEAGLAIQQKAPSQILFVVPEGAHLPPSFSTYKYLVRSADLSEFRDDFLNDLRSWLSRQDKIADRFNRTEPERLLALREYNAALISAVTLLEVALSSALDVVENDRRRLSLAEMLRDADRRGLFEKGEYAMIKDAVSLRNKIIHTSATVGREPVEQLVRTIVSFVERLLGPLSEEP